METMQAQQPSAMNPEPQKEHLWLHKLIGMWVYESEVLMGPGQPLARGTGTEVVRSLGELWIIAEGQGEMPGCGAANTIMTLGYDGQQQRYVGTWVGSMMTYLWVYNGGLDAEERVLTLHSEGPDMVGEGKIAQYRDVIEFKGDNHRVMTSHALGNDGQWHQFMTANYRRQP